MKEHKNLSENLKKAVIPNTNLSGEGYRQQSAQVLKWMLRLDTNLSAHLLQKQHNPSLGPLQNWVYCFLRSQE